jgi:hypothetical protein
MDIFVKKIHVLQLKGLCFAAEGFDGGGVEILLDSTQPSCCWKEGSFGQQDINTHGKVSNLRLTKNISFSKSEAIHALRRTTWLCVRISVRFRQN